MTKLRLTLLTALLLVPLAALHAADASLAKPNIVFIFTDDWGWGDLSCHGHPYVKTPNIDRLADEGTDFSRFTVASGVCSPSRTAVMTGHFPARYNIDGHFAWAKNNAQRNMPDWLDPKTGGKESEFHWANYAVLDRQWKQLMTDDSKRLELYDIAADPLETKDISFDQPGLVKEIIVKLERWKSTLPDKPSGEVFSAERLKQELEKL